MTNIITVRQVRTRSVNGRVSQHRTVPGRYIDAQTSIPGPRRSVWTHLPVLRRDIPEAREKGFIVTNIITVRHVRTRSVNGRVSQHRTVWGKHIDAQTSIPGPLRSVWTHLPVLRRDIPEAREKGFITAPGRGLLVK